jgi:hypothetical protein
LLQQVPAEPAWAKRLTDEDRRGLTALFWSNINPYGTFRLDMDKRLDLVPVTVPGPRRAADAPARSRVPVAIADADVEAGGELGVGMAAAQVGQGKEGLTAGGQSAPAGTACAAASAQPRR